MSRLYIRVMTGFYSHRKTVKLKIKVGNDAFWIPPRLWAYAAENQPDGDLSAYSSEEIAELLGCNKYASSILQALKDSGFIDETGYIHDWKIHNGYHETFSERAKKAASARWSKTEKGNRKEESGDKHCSSNATSINQDLEMIEKIYSAYPKKVGKPAALKAIKTAMSKLEPSKLLEITQAYAKRRNGDLQFVPHPSTWFNQERYNDDPSTWTTETPKTNGQPQPQKRSWDDVKISDCQ